MRPEDKETLCCKWQTYNATCQNRAEIQELRSQVQELGHTVATQSTPPTDTISVSQSSQVSQLTTTNNSIMGERNEQTQNRQARRAGAVTTRHHIQSSTTVNRSWIDPPENTCADNECDTNADTCCLGNILLFWLLDFAQLTSMPTSHPYNRSRTYQLYLGQQHMAIQFPATHISLISTNPYIMAANWTNHILTPINCAHTAYTYGTIHLILALQSLLSINVNPTLTIPLRAHGT